GGEGEGRGGSEGAGWRRVTPTGCNMAGSLGRLERCHGVAVPLHSGVAAWRCAPLPAATPRFPSPAGGRGREGRGRSPAGGKGGRDTLAAERPSQPISLPAWSPH